MKLLTITRCEECPQFRDTTYYRRMNSKGAMKSGYDHACCLMVDRDFGPNRKLIPAWCPLQDAPTDETKGGE